ncbi:MULTISPECIES: NRDE family protein [Luteimonas]|uniref:NRDE family protein n=1 Tax=Luteimonas TaxID=83614 RepID=UPI000C7BD1C9|nr:MULTISPECIES: NRDE family protein [Luteimonas]
MCLIAVAWNTRPDLPLALIANRDEFHARPTAPAGPDPDAPDVYGGRDLVQHGSWLLAASRRRLAAVTNVRRGSAVETAPRSRGWLVRDFVHGALSAPAFAQALAADAPAYGRFNLLLWDGPSLWFASNHPRFVAAPVSPGLHAMSNGAFDAPWPKSNAASATLRDWLATRAAPLEVDTLDDEAIAPLFAGLRSTTPAPDDTLPDTGVGLALERQLSPPFLVDDRYGTRCSSVVLVSPAQLLFVERRFAPGGVPSGEARIVLRDRAGAAG